MLDNPTREIVDEDFVPAATFPPRQPRRPFKIPVRLRAGPQLLRLDSIDISLGGMKLNLPPDVDRTELNRGTFVLINAPHFSSPRLSTIAWTNKDHIGLRFNMALDHAELNSITQRIMLNPVQGA